MEPTNPWCRNDDGILCNQPTDRPTYSILLYSILFYSKPHSSTMCLDDDLFNGRNGADQAGRALLLADRHEPTCIVYIHPSSS